MLKWLASKLRRRHVSGLSTEVVKLLVAGTTDQQFLEALKMRRDKRWSPLPAPGVYMRKGEWITCEGIGDHPIVQIGCEIRVGDLWKPDQFAIWAQPEPLRGTPSKFCRCILCDQRWFDGMGHYHFSDGWRK